MNIFKIFHILLISIFLMGGASATTDYCPKKHKIVEHRTLVCYRGTLSDVQIHKLEDHLTKTVRLYPEFIQQYDIVWKKPEGVLAIVILSKKEMNSPAVFAELFPNYANLVMGNVDARYFPEENILCITKAATATGNSALPHEAVHWLNKAAGVTSKQRDEIIAYAFEPYYFSHK